MRERGLRFGGSLIMIDLQYQQEHGRWRRGQYCGFVAAACFRMNIRPNRERRARKELPWERSAALGERAVRDKTGIPTFPSRAKVETAAALMAERLTFSQVA